MGISGELVVVGYTGLLGPDTGGQGSARRGDATGEGLVVEKSLELRQRLARDDGGGGCARIKVCSACVCAQKSSAWIRQSFSRRVLGQSGNSGGQRQGEAGVGQWLP